MGAHASRAEWERRVAGRRTSGLSSEAYCRGKAFSASGLRYWAQRLRREGKAQAERLPVAPSVRIGRVLRVPSPRMFLPPAEAAPAGGTHWDSAIAIECGPGRIVVRPGFDGATLAAVLDVVAARGVGW